MNTEKSELKYKKITEGSIRSLILHFAAPTTVGMTVIALYSLADAFFVSELGTSASAAVGVTFAIQALIQAIGYTLGMGAGSLISRNLGEKKTEDATKYAKISFFLSVVSGIMIAIVGMIFGKQIVRLLGATDSIYPYAASYSVYLFLSAPFACATFVLSQLLRAEGKVWYAMTGLASGSILNIILDPILIKTFRLGIAGASLATLISQGVGTLVLISAYFFKFSQIHIFKRTKLDLLHKTGPILFTGAPSALRQGLTVLATVLTNHAAKVWGDPAVAALSVVTRLFLLAFSICLGVGQGMMPVVGYNLGSRNDQRVKEAYLFSVFLSSFAMLLVSIPFYILAPPLVTLFRNDKSVIKIGVQALRIQCGAFFMHGLITCTIMMLQAIGKQFSAMLLACARQGLFFVPLILWLPSIFGIQAVIWVQPLADAFTFLLAIPFFLSQLRRFERKKPQRRLLCGKQIR